MNGKSLAFALGLAVAAASATASRADTFLLKDGTQYEGTASEEGDTLVITTYAGVVVRVPKNTVAGSKAEPNRNAFYVRARSVKAGDAAGQYELGRWAAGNGLPREAREQFLLALQADPAHEGAGKALGYVFKDGRWAPPNNEGLTIAPTPGGKGDPRAEAEEARKLAKKLETLAVQDEADFERVADGPALVARAREQPGLFARILKLPGLLGSANAANPAVRARAAQLLGLGGDRRGLQPLLDACFEDSDDGVRRAAAKGLVRLDEPIALRKLVDVALAARFPWPTRRLACLALRRYGDKEAVERVLGEVSFELAGGNPRDPKNPLRGRQGGLGVDNPLGNPEAPIGPTDEHILYPALSALKELTGVSFHDGEKDFKTWRDWWKTNGPAFKFKE